MPTTIILRCSYETATTQHKLNATPSTTPPNTTPNSNSARECSGHHGSLDQAGYEPQTKALRSIRMFKGRFDYPTTHVWCYPGPSDQISSWRLEQHKWHQPFFLEHHGCILDIDTKSEFVQSEKVMAALLDTDYFDPENIHLEHPISGKSH